MAARFLYLRNGGSPTHWDVSRYFEYLSQIRPRLPNDLRSLTASERYYLPSGSDLSIWRSGITYIQVNRERISIGAANEHGTRRFEFTYSGVRKVQTTKSTLFSLPSIVVQELVQLRNGFYRHTFSDMTGDFATIHATAMSFQESIIQ